MTTRIRLRLAAVLCLLVQAAGLVCAQTTGEFEVKAAYLLNFAKFVEWPESALAEAAPIAICVVGDDPFGRVLDQVVEGEAVGSHKITVQRLRTLEANACHIAYFGKGARAAAELTGVLTVGEDEEFLRGGGMVSFAVENRRVRFDVSMGAVKRSGLRVSSRLLQVARTVKR